MILEKLYMDLLRIIFVLLMELLFLFLDLQIMRNRRKFIQEEKKKHVLNSLIICSINGNFLNFFSLRKFFSIGKIIYASPLSKKKQ